jgi:chemotaxis response regulator CheB
VETRLEDEPIFQDMPQEGMRFSSFSDDAEAEQLGDLDADVAALAAQLEAFEKSDTRAAPAEPEFARAPPKEDKASMAGLDAPSVMPKGGKATAKPASVAAASAGSGAAGNFDFSNLSLAPEDGEAALAKAPPIEVKFSKPAEPVAAKKPSFGALSLEGEAPAAAAAAAGAGAVLILAGLGGPDAVRQLLSTLPDRLSVPVLLYQHLEVGKHERLVDQLAKISKLPVQLARENDAPDAGKVTLLPAGMTAVASGSGLRFTPGSLTQLISALTPPESMVIVLSGADVQLVPMILAVKEEGGSVLAQDPELCFDADAATAMRKEGAQVLPALGLARQIASRWPA